MIGRVTDLRCVDCGGPIPDARKRTATLCAVCVRERQRKMNRERARLKREQARERNRT
jgi:RNA polymerase-binding transcription factor DksA